MSEDKPAGDPELADYSDSDVERLTSILDELGPEASDPWGLLQSLTTRLAGDDLELDRSPLEHYLERALAYAVEDDPEHRGAVTIGVRLSSASGDWPPAFDVVPVVEKDAWAALGEKVTDLLPRAQLLDLSLTTDVRSGRDAGENVARTYFELAARQELDPYYRGSCLRRAWSIARQYGLELEADVRAGLMTMAMSLANVANVPTGVLLQPLESLVVAPRSKEFTNPSRDEVADVLKAARERPGVHATLMEGVAELLVTLAQTEDERTAARRALVEGYLTIAERDAGITRAHWLQEAVAKAQQFGFVDLRERGMSTLQAGSVNELGLQAMTSTFTLPRHAYDARLSRYRWSRDVRTALDIWFTSDSPTGSNEENLRQATKQSSRGILQLITRTVFNSSGLPVRTTSGPEAAEREQLERIEAMNASMHSIILARELEAIKTEYGAIPGQDIGAHLVSQFHCDAELTFALGDAIGSFWDKRYSDAGRAAYPLIEAGARGLLLAVNEPLYRIQTGNADGRFPALEKYIERLETRGFDIDWLRCLRNPVAALRNALAHGHRHSLRDHEAALLLRTAAVLVLLTPSNSSAEDRAQVDARLRDPVGWAASRAKLRLRWRRVHVGSRR